MADTKQTETPKAPTPAPTREPVIEEFMLEKTWFRNGNRLRAKGVIKNPGDVTLRELPGDAKIMFEGKQMRVSAVRAALAKKD